MSEHPMRAVLDCMVFAQALINPDGPADECVVRGSEQQFLTRECFSSAFAVGVDCYGFRRTAPVSALVTIQA